MVGGIQMKSKLFGAVALGGALAFTAVPQPHSDDLIFAA